MVIIHMIFIDVVDTDSSKRFNTLVKQKPTLAQFFSPGCGYCDELKPEWDSLEAMLKEKYDGDMMIARVRADMMDSVKCDKNIRGFPTIFVLEKGKKRGEFTKTRNASSLLEFIGENFKISKKSQGGGGRKRRRRGRRNRRKTKRRKRITRRKRVRKRSRRLKRRRRTFRRRKV
jgi:thiol-disulfide isomerase/thioredoxin